MLLHDCASPPKKTLTLFWCAEQADRSRPVIPFQPSAFSNKCARLAFNWWHPPTFAASLRTRGAKKISDTFVLSSRVKPTARPTPGGGRDSVQFPSGFYVIVFVLVDRSSETSLPPFYLDCSFCHLFTEFRIKDKDFFFFFLAGRMSLWFPQSNFLGGKKRTFRIWWNTQVS